MSAGSSALQVSVWRGAQQGRYETYEVPLRESQTVLDVVTFVQRHLDPTLSYRFACRVGVCGSCAMTVNGRPRWTCRTHVSKVAENGRIEIGPLENLPVIKDLATDMRPFFEKWQQAKGAFVPSKTRDDPIERSSRAARHALRPMPRSNASTAASATRPAIRCAGTRAISDRLRSTARGRSSMTSAMPEMPHACGRSRLPADATPATRTSPARNIARRRSIPPPPSPASSAAPCAPISRARSRHERAALRLAAADRGA